jgi:hypothetical protein
MKEVLCYIWMLPQNLLGELLVFIIRPKRLYNKGHIYITDIFSGAISLGYTIVVGSNMPLRQTLYHESGHCVQSMLLGWLYLPVIGIPSLLWACIHTLIGKNFNWNYYKFPTESNANYWGAKVMGKINE